MNDVMYQHPVTRGRMKACADVLRVPQEEIKNEAVEKVCNNTIVHVTQCISVCSVCSLMVLNWRPQQL